MPLSCQADKFDLSEDYTYLNCAYMSPNLRSVERAGIEGVKLKTQPFRIEPADFFTRVKHLKLLFSNLINAGEPERIALIPSASYGLANVVNNLKPGKKKKIVIAGEQFPSNFYVWQRLAVRQHLSLDIIDPPAGVVNRGELWNQRLVRAIDADTILVAIGHVHWTDGTLFDLKALGEHCRRVEALLIVDGTQSLGALPFDVQQLQPDALICAGYKWLLGPYGLGLAYYGPYFDEGIPIEESWINRIDSDDFEHLINYNKQYRPLANRYSVGEQSNFILVPMLTAALEQLLDWGIGRIQHYCRELTTEGLSCLTSMGAIIEPAAYRAAHLFGIRFGDRFDPQVLQQELYRRRVMVSFRGNAMRISAHVFNTEEDINRLMACFEVARRKQY